MYSVQAFSFLERPTSRRFRPSARRGAARVAMALSTLSGDEQGVILGQLRNALEPRLVMYFSSARCRRRRSSS